MFFLASSVRLEGFKVTTDFTGMCWITFVAAVDLLTDSCACHGTCLPSVRNCLVLVSGWVVFTACCTTYLPPLCLGTFWYFCAAVLDRRELDVNSSQRGPWPFGWVQAAAGICDRGRVQARARKPPSNPRLSPIRVQPWQQFSRTTTSKLSAWHFFCLVSFYIWAADMFRGIQGCKVLMFLHLMSTPSPTFPKYWCIFIWPFVRKRK